MKAEPGFVFYCLGWNAWGRGVTDAIAIRNWRNAGPFTTAKRVKVVLVKAHEDSYVDGEDVGVIHTPVGLPRAEKVEEREVSA